MARRGGRSGDVADPRSRRVRQLAVDDTAPAAAWAIRDLPVSRALAAALPKLLRRLIGEETLRGICIEDASGTRGTRRLAAVGVSGFLSDACVSSFLAAPFPHFEVALLERARVPGSGPGLLDIHEVARANAGGGLTLYPLFWLHHSNDIGTEESNALRSLGQQAFLRVHRGYRLKCILKEADARLAGAYTSGGFREHLRLPAGMPMPLADDRSKTDRIVFMTTAEDIKGALPGAAIGPLFAFTAPRCAFTRNQQKVLEAAVDNKTDREIAMLLNTNANAVAQHWRKIYMRVERELPFVFDGLAAGEGTRGHEKRRRVVAYIADHMEELRPYATRST
jgi:DNA-binding CsgD family transcriptional regulator